MSSPSAQPLSFLHTWCTYPDTHFRGGDPSRQAYAPTPRHLIPTATPSRTAVCSLLQAGGVCSIDQKVAPCSLPYVWFVYSFPQFRPPIEKEKLRAGKRFRTSTRPTRNGRKRQRCRKRKREREKKTLAAKPKGKRRATAYNDHTVTLVLLRPPADTSLCPGALRAVHALLNLSLHILLL